MSNPIVMQKLERTEIDWSDEPGNEGLLINQSDSMGDGDDAIWIPEGHVAAFIAAIQRAYAKR